MSNERQSIKKRIEKYRTKVGLDGILGEVVAVELATIEDNGGEKQKEFLELAVQVWQDPRIRERAPKHYTTTAPYEHYAVEVFEAISEAMTHGYDTNITQLKDRVNYMIYEQQKEIP